MNKFTFGFIASVFSLALHAQGVTNVEVVGQSIDKYLSQPDLRFDGAAAIVVHEGKVVFRKGYGYSDGLSQSKPVDPATTRFEIASITKTFTGTRIAQLVEKGLIKSIDDPANKYLIGLQLPDNQGKAITIRHLLTHQAGFAEASMHDFAEGQQIPIGDAAYFKSKVPAFIRPVEQGANYSNFGFGVLGRIIADVTGTSGDQAFKQGIWMPLGMTSTESKLLNKEYANRIKPTAFYPDGSRTSLPTGGVSDPIITSGAGNTLSTADDIARYMLGLLGGSKDLDIPPIVKAETRDWMFSKLGKNDLVSQAYGTAFMINDWNGTQIVEHGGRALAAQSVLILLPAKKMGIFITVSGEGGAPSASDLFLQIIGKGRMVATPGVERFRTPNLFTLRAAPLVALLGWPSKPDVSKIPSEGKDIALDQFSGSFEADRRMIKSPMKWVDWLIKGTVVNVAPDGKGGLRVGWSDGYKPIAKDVFWREPAQDPKRLLGWNELVVFERDSTGSVQRMWFGYTDTTFTKLESSVTPSRAIALTQLGAVGMLLGLGALFWAKGTRGKRLALLSPLMLLLLPYAFFGFWPDVAPAPYNILYLEPKHIWPFVLLGNAIALSALFQLWAVFQKPPSEVGSIRKWAQRIHLGIVALGTCAMAWGLTILNGTGWPF